MSNGRGFVGIMRDYAKNVGPVREAVRRVRARRSRRVLEGLVTDLECMDRGSYAEVQGNPFGSVTLELGERDLSDIDSASFAAYFKEVDRSASTLHITNRFPGSPFFTRQRMLATAYQRIGVGRGADVSMADLGGSNGYYSFLAACHGISRAVVYDARPLHNRQFELIKRSVGPTLPITFVLLNLETNEIPQTFDITLAQGILYHLYDHLHFLRRLFVKTEQALLLETELCGRRDFYNLCKLEDPSNPRMGVSLGLYPSYPTLLALLQAVGYRRLTRILPPRDEMDLHGYRRGRRVMLICEKR